MIKAYLDDKVSVIAGICLFLMGKKTKWLSQYPVFLNWMAGLEQILYKAHLGAVPVGLIDPALLVVQV